MQALNTEITYFNTVWYPAHKNNQTGQADQTVYEFKSINLKVSAIENIAPVIVDRTTNHAPTANNDSRSATEDVTLVAASVLGNDTDADGGDLEVAVVKVGATTIVDGGVGDLDGVANGSIKFSTTAGGTATLDTETGTFSYVQSGAYNHLSAGETGSDSFQYQATDGIGSSGFATVSVTITGTNDGPVAVADTASGSENQALTIDVLANDTDVDDGHVFTLLSASAPSNQGSASVASNKLVFDPGTDFDHLAEGATATVTLNYTMQDEHGAQSSSTVTVTITGTNDGPVAVADTASGSENQALTIDVLANDTDVDDGHVFTLLSASAPSNQGSASVASNKLVFDPGTDFDHLAEGATATVTLNYTMQDEHGAQSSSTVTVTITGTNDGPVAVADTASGSENQALTIDVLANDTDVDDGHVFTLLSASAPSNQGSASVASNKLVFDPGTDFDHLAEGATATVTLNYTMQDEHGAQSSSTVTVTITGTNDGPVAVADTASGSENQALTIDVLANDTDVDDGHVFTLLSASAPSNQGSASVASNKLVFDPGTDFDHLAEGATATVTLNYTMQDEHGAQSSSTVTVTITGTNDGPVAVADTASGSENQALTIDVLANDTDVDDGHVFTLLSASAPSNQGSASVASNKLVFDPGTDFDHLAEGATATVTLNYTMQDEHGAQSSSTVTVTITGTNDGPVAVADTASGSENQALTIDVLANDTDVDDGHVFTLLSASAPSNQGSASVASNKLVFDPGTDFDHLAEGATATVTLNYTMQDEHGAQSSSTVTVTITGTNDGPVAVADTASGSENQALTIDVLANDTDVDDGHVFTLLSASAPSNQGSASVASNKLVFDPGTDFDHLAEGATATVTLNYTMQDEHGAQSSSTVTVTITGTNDGPVAVADTASGSENQALTIDVLANDTDVDDGHVFTLLSASAPSNQGSASVASNKLVFDPGTDFDHLAEGATATVTLNYTMQDEHGAQSSSTVTVTITGTNDGPVAVADTASGSENQALTIDVLANDTDVDDGHVFTLLSASAPSNQGSASVASNKLVFDPGTDFDHLAEGATATVTLNYTMQDEHGAQSSSTVTVTITGTNDGPVAVADTASGSENQALTIDVLANDTDVDDGHVFTLLSASAPSNQGSASVASNKLVFDPGTDFDHLAEGATATVTLNYTMQDEHGAQSSSTVTVTITGTNDGPVLAPVNAGSISEIDQSASTVDSGLSGTLAGADIDSNALTYGIGGIGVIVNGDGTVSKVGTYGTLTVDTISGTYSFAKNVAAIEALDAGDSDSDSFTVTVNDGNAAPATQTYTVQVVGASDVPPTLSINDVTVSEGAGATFTLSLSSASGQSVSVQYATANGTADASDYAAASGTVTFAPGEVSKTVTVATVNDLLDEPNETFTVNLGNSTNATILDGLGVGTILDNDNPPSITINDVPINEGAGATFTVSLSAASGQSVSVQYATANGTADASDYAPASGTVTFAPGEVSKTFTVATTNDLLDEPNETFTVNLNAPTNATISDGVGIATILDNDNPPTISISNAAVTEGGLLNFTVSLSAASGNTVSVNYLSANATALSGDYASVSGTLIFAPGITSQTITIQTTQDTIAELSEALIVNLSSPVNATILDAKGVGTIGDNDALPANATTVNVGTGTNSSAANAVNIDNLVLQLSNDPEITSASSRPSVTIAATGTINEFDYYKFTVTTNGTLVVLDIDHGQDSTGNIGNVSHYDSWINILNSSQTIIASNDDSSPVDPGSVHHNDSFLAATLNAGTYYVQVGRWASGDPDGTTFNAAVTYELQVSLTPPTVTDPLILDLGQNGYTFSSIAEGVSFDINGDGTRDQVAWNSSGDGILAMDLNGNGLIDDGTELFTPVFGAGSFSSGGEALASLDSNHDQLIDSNDQAFQNLLIWKDADVDGSTDEGELTSLSDAGIETIEVPSTPTSNEISGQEVIGEGIFTRADGSSGSYVEVALDVATNAPPENKLLTGGDGDDMIFGLAGIGETFAGGAGADTFVFNDVKAADMVADYQFGEDKVDLTSLLDIGDGDVHDFVSYDSLNGTLKVDLDGAGGGEAVTIATFNNTPQNLTIIVDNGLHIL
ncbi:Ig-like domain-containing protein [Bradyrhizobium sp. C-145]|nr:Ig-like domain-containing protein [Bradyrhizobium sp. C-145]